MIVRVITVLAECGRLVRSQKATSVVVAVLVAVQCIAVALTAGRAASTQQDILSRIDDQDTRSITVRASADAPVPTQFLDVLAATTEVEQVVGLGPIFDASNAAYPAGPPIPLRRAYGVLEGVRLTQTSDPRFAEMAWISQRAADTLGMTTDSGALVAGSGHQFPAVRVWGTAPLLAEQEPLALIPASATDRLAGANPTDPLTLLVILAREPADVTSLEPLVRTLIRDAAVPGADVTTSADMAAVRELVSGELTDYGRRTTLGVLSIGLIVTALALLALTHLRRREFGRRRALGASQSIVLSLVLGQTTFSAALGAALGTLGITIWMHSQDGGPPPWPFLAAIAILTITCAALAALVPALVAARRDPLKELRVP